MSYTRMVFTVGVEPTLYRVLADCLCQLDYVNMVLYPGVEPDILA